MATRPVLSPPAVITIIWGSNTWAGVGAPPPPKDAARLNWYTIRLPDEAARTAVVDRIRQAGLPLAEDDDALMVPRSGAE